MCWLLRNIDKKVKQISKEKKEKRTIFYDLPEGTIRTIRLPKSNVPYELDNSLEFKWKLDQNKMIIASENSLKKIGTFVRSQNTRKTMLNHGRPIHGLQQNNNPEYRKFNSVQMETNRLFPPCLPPLTTTIINDNTNDTLINLSGPKLPVSYNQKTIKKKQESINNNNNKKKSSIKLTDSNKPSIVNQNQKPQSIDNHTDDDDDETEMINTSEDYDSSYSVSDYSIVSK